MRFINIDNIRVGDILAKPLYIYGDDVIHFEKGKRLIDKNISLIRDYGFSGLYIEDELTEGIDVEDVVDGQLKGELVSKLKKAFYNNAETLNNKEKQDYLCDNVIRNYVSDLVDAIHGKKVSVKIMDLKEYDFYTFRHSVNVAVLSLIIGDELNFDRKQMEELAMASLFHDIGKRFIPISVLNKETPLTHEELLLLKQHSLLGAKWVQQQFSSISKDVIRGIAQHHEKLNGSGYPFGLKDDDIGLFGRIIAVCDIYDALTSKRPYHDAFLPSEAVKLLHKYVGNQELDMSIVTAFLRRVYPYPIGVVVKLSNLETGIVIEQNIDNIERPVLRLVNPDSGKRLVDLCHDVNYHNVTIIDVEK